MKLQLKSFFLRLLAPAGLAAAALLSACAPGTLVFTPEQAAVQAVTRMRGSEVVINQNSLQVRQTIEVSGKIFVLLSYSQQTEGHQEQCLSMFETHKSTLNSWSPGGGGGGCTWQIGGSSPEDVQPLEIAAGHNSGSGLNSPGFCEIYGLVNQKDIVKVRVTWNDDNPQEVNVINGTYLIVRVGNYQMKKIEGLDANGKVVYNDTPSQPAPGKQ